MSSLEGHAEECYLRDLGALDRLRREIQLAEGRGVPIDALRAEWERIQGASRARVRARRERMVGIDYPLDLPILAHKSEILEALRLHPVIVVAGETGSGKSTQLPKFCLEAGLGARGWIGHTQPRRLAARTIATRLAEELGGGLGDKVGFKVRFHDRTAPDTLVKLMTDGILLAETQTDRRLEAYEVIILDEAHERSLNVDFLMGYLRRLLPRRKELRVIITSATIEVERFRDHFALGPRPVPLIHVAGRSYPVDIRYRPPQRDGERDETLEPFATVLRCVRELAEIDQGHILIFLPTERDIRELGRKLQGWLVAGGLPGNTEILPLFARLTDAEQQRIFQPCLGRRIVLATNVAESSLTVPGIKYVIDTGTARISRYSPRSKVQRLPIEAISQASAKQRAGRCGRLAAGICLRTYSEEDFSQRSEYTSPEIHRTNLAAVILRAKHLDLGSVEKYPFLDPPNPESIRDGYKTLFEIGALDESRQITPLGRRLAAWPIDPRIGRVLIAAEDEGCLPEVMVIAAALEAQDPRDRPLDRQSLADERHARFKDPDSDFLGFLRIWEFQRKLKEELSQSRFRKACIENFLSFARLREWNEILQQWQRVIPKSVGHRRPRSTVQDNAQARLAELFDEQGSVDPKRYAAIHRALLTGFLSGVAMRIGEREYQGGGGLKFQLWPGSGLCAARPRWCLAAELVETTRRYARTVARVEPEWVEPLAEHLVTRAYHDPHWHHKRMTVMAFERVSLHGLPLVERRRIPYARIDPVHAREIFLREGLRHDGSAAGDLSRESPSERHEVAERARRALEQVAAQDKSLPLPSPRTDRLSQEPFFRHNEEVLRQASRLAAKARRGDYFIDDYAIRGFYNARVPAGVYDFTTLRQWFVAQPANEQLLKMQLADFVAAPDEDPEDSNYPDELRFGEMTLPLTYHFAPGAAEDGITVTVPEDGLRQLRVGQTEWLIPGLLEEKITALIRSLPKELRTNFIPAPDVARQLAAQLRFGEGEFLPQLVQKMNLRSREPIRADAFDFDKLPPHLRLNFQIVDRSGAALAGGRDLAELHARWITPGSQPTSGEPIVTESLWRRDDVTAWDWDELPMQVMLDRGGIGVPAYPAIVDAGSSAALRLQSTLESARHLTRFGTRRLLALEFKKSLRAQVSWLPMMQQIAIRAATLLSSDELRQQVADLIAERAFLANERDPPCNRQAFDRLRNGAGEKIAEGTQDVAKLLPRLFEAYHQAQIAWEDRKEPRWRYVREDVREQIELLTTARFLAETPWRWLQEYPRYFRAIAIRMERLSIQSHARDQEATRELQGLVALWMRRRDEHQAAARVDSELETYRWMLEEYRVSLFAQTLGTSVPVSAKRLEKQWERVT